MTVLYVREQGARISRQGERVQVVHQNEILHETAVRDLDQVIVYGNVQMTTQAATLLVTHDVDVVFYSLYGRFRYRLLQGGARYARLRQAQLRTLEDPGRMLALAMAVVSGKLRNQEQALAAWAQRWQKGAEMQSTRRAVAGVREMLAASGRSQNLDVLRGFEGKAAAYYFEAMKTYVPAEWQFTARAYYPPPDAWNATLSFGYSLLLKDVSAAVHLVGLDPYVGFFHALEANRPALALDLMEEFRPLVDDVALALLKAGELPLHLYERRRQHGDGVLMGGSLLPVYIKAYEARMEQAAAHQASGQRTALRRCLELQARQMAAVILGERQSYQPMRLVFASTGL